MRGKHVRYRSVNAPVEQRAFLYKPLFASPRLSSTSSTLRWSKYNDTRLSDLSVFCRCRHKFGAGLCGNVDEQTDLNSASLLQQRP